MERKAIIKLENGQKKRITYTRNQVIDGIHHFFRKGKETLKYSVDEVSELIPLEVKKNGNLD